MDSRWRVMPPYRRPVNMVFQNYAIFPHLNVFQTLPMACARTDLASRKKRRVEGALR